MQNVFYIGPTEYLNIQEWGLPLLWIHSDGSFEEPNDEQYQNPNNDGFYTCWANNKRIGVKPQYYDTWLALGCPSPEDITTKKQYWWLLLLLIPVYYLWKKYKRK